MWLDCIWNSDGKKIRSAPAQAQRGHFPHRPQPLTRRSHFLGPSGGRQKNWCLLPFTGEVAAQPLWLPDDGSVERRHGYRAQPRAVTRGGCKVEILP